jgi:hypothetical protein
MLTPYLQCSPPAARSRRLTSDATPFAPRHRDAITVYQAEARDRQHWSGDLARWTESRAIAMSPTSALDALGGACRGLQGVLGTCYLIRQDRQSNGRDERCHGRPDLSITASLVQCAAMGRRCWSWSMAPLHRVNQSLPIDQAHHVLLASVMRAAPPFRRRGQGSTGGVFSTRTRAHSLFHVGLRIPRSIPTGRLGACPRHRQGLRSSCVPPGAGGG